MPDGGREFAADILKDARLCRRLIDRLFYQVQDEMANHRHVASAWPRLSCQPQDRDAFSVRSAQTHHSARPVSLPLEGVVMPRSIHFGAFLLGTGNHTAGWRYPGADQTFLDIKVLQRVAAIAERGLFDFLFLGDGLAANLRSHPSYTCRLEPLTLLSALSMTTTLIGLAATMSTTYSDPYTVARMFASLDHISGGRAAWNAVTTSASAAGGNFGRAHPDHELRYEIAEEFINVVRGLWDCWSDKAVIADLATGRFFDESEVRPLDHEGPHFSVKGPLNMGRCPQGRPLVLQAGGSDRGLNLAARTADVVFSVVQDFDEARTAYADLKARIRRFGRDPDSVTILPGVMLIVGETDAAARDVLNT